MALSAFRTASLTGMRFPISLGPTAYCTVHVLSCRYLPLTNNPRANHHPKPMLHMPKGFDGFDGLLLRSRTKRLGRKGRDSARHTSLGRLSGGRIPKFKLSLSGTGFMALAWRGVRLKRRNHASTRPSLQAWPFYTASSCGFACMK